MPKTYYNLTKANRARCKGKDRGRVSTCVATKQFHLIRSLFSRSVEIITMRGLLTCVAKCHREHFDDLIRGMMKKNLVPTRILKKLNDIAHQPYHKPKCHQKLTSSIVILGGFLASGANHKKIPYKLPIPSCKAEIVKGNPVAPPAAFSANLFDTL